MRKFRINTRFTNVPTLKKALADHFQTAVTEIGYIMPRHGARGKQHWICEDIDIEDMYNAYKGKKEITLWFYTKTDEGPKKGKKCPRSPEKPSKTVNSDKMEEVEEILTELKKKAYW